MLMKFALQPLGCGHPAHHLNSNAFSVSIPYSLIHTARCKEQPCLRCSRCPDCHSAPNIVVLGKEGRGGIGMVKMPPPPIPRKATTTGPDATHPPAICQNLGGVVGGGDGREGVGGGGGIGSNTRFVTALLLAHHGVPLLQRFSRSTVAMVCPWGCTKGAEQGPNTWYPLQRQQSKDQTQSTPFNEACKKIHQRRWCHDPHATISQNSGGGGGLGGGVTSKDRARPPPMCRALLLRWGYLEWVGV